MKVLWLTAIGVATVMVGMNAHAGFLVETKSVSVQPQECGSPGVVDVGNPIAARPLVAPVTTEEASSALRRILPRDWSIGGDPPPGVRVSWRGGSSWIDVLDGVAIDAGLCVALDHVRQTATIRVIATSAPVAAVEAEDAALVDVHDVVDVRDVAVDDAADVVPIEDLGDDRGVATDLVETAPAVPATIFGIKGGEVLEETLSRWCDAEGWTLVWEVDAFEYPQEVTYDFPAGTTFEDAVRTVIRAYWQTRHPLVARPALNHVLVITGR